jgi:hypothetical protein
MRTIFPGYFTPTEEEFTKLWSDCLFGFDANVLLGLYRSTAETQKVFFSVLEKIADRIFLPHQAASEYLKNRLGVISNRSDSYGRITDESEKFAKLVESIGQEHSLADGEEIARVAREAADKIKVLAEAGAEKEPDLLRADDLLGRIARFFETKTSHPYPDPRLKEVYAEGAQRYAQRIPPGYKDDKKTEPERYGDLLIWFQLIDQARLMKKPVIFVTGDAKEDWWLEHHGATIGPRPELRQEMMAAAGVSFYMYTTPRFLEFAKQFLGLSFDTKRAESEFEKIEKQDKQATEQRGLPVSEDYPEYYPNYPTSADGWRALYPAYLGTQPTNFGYNFIPYNPNAGGYTSFVSSPVLVPEDSESKNKYFALLPLNGNVYRSRTGKWKCEIVNHPNSIENDRACYRLKFEPEDLGRGLTSRVLDLCVSASRLERDIDWQYKAAINRAISRWLDLNQASGEIAFLG